MAREWTKDLPNWLTFVRIALIPIFVVLLVEPTKSMIYAAVAIFVFAALTDSVDGFLARRYGAVSDFGKLLDPLADKILVTAALVMLVSLRSDATGEPWVPGWMVVLVLAREIWVTGLRGIAASRGLIVPAASSGKWKSVLQMVAIVFLLLHDMRLRLFGLVFDCQLVGFNLLLISLAFSYWGASEYSYAILMGGTEKDGEKRAELVH